MMKTPQLSINLFKNASFLTISTTIVAIISFLQSIIITRGLGLILFGKWSLILSLYSTLKAFLSFRTGEALTRKIAHIRKGRDFEELEEIEKLEEILSISLGIDFITNVIATICVIIIATLIKNYTNIIMIPCIIYAIAGLFSSIENVWFVIMREAEKFKALALIPIIVSSFKLILVSIAWFSKLLTIDNLALIFLFVSVMQSIIKYCGFRNVIADKYQIKKLRIQINLSSINKDSLKDYWDFMKSSYISSSISTFAKNGDVLILGFFRDEAIVGLYKLAKNLGTLILNVGNSLSSAIYHDLSKVYYQKKIGLFLEQVKKFSRYWIPLVAFGYFFSFIFSQRLIVIVFGIEYSSAYKSFNIIMIGVVIRIMLFWAHPAALAFGEYRYVLKLTIFVSSLSLTFMLILGFILGDVGVAIISSIMWVSLYTGYYYRITKNNQTDKEI